MSNQTEERDSNQDGQLESWSRDTYVYDSDNRLIQHHEESDANGDGTLNNEQTTAYTYQACD